MEKRRFREEKYVMLLRYFLRKRIDKDTSELLQYRSDQETIQVSEFLKNASLPGGTGRDAEADKVPVDHSLTGKTVLEIQQRMR